MEQNQINTKKYNTSFLVSMIFVRNFSECSDCFLTFEGNSHIRVRLSHWLLCSHLFHPKLKKQLLGFSYLPILLSQEKKLSFSSFLREFYLFYTKCTVVKSFFLLILYVICKSKSVSKWIEQQHVVEPLNFLAGFRKCAYSIFVSKGYL